MYAIEADFDVLHLPFMFCQTSPLPRFPASLMAGRLLPNTLKSYSAALRRNVRKQEVVDLR